MKIVQPLKILDSNLLSSNVPENDYPAYSTSVGYLFGDKRMVVGPNLHKVYEALKGAKHTVTLTVASPTVVTLPSTHNLTEGMPIVFTTTGTLPVGVVAGTTYYVKGLNGLTCNISASVGGTNINTGGTQSGVHTINTNYNVPVTNTDYWLEVSSTNRWKMFDEKVQSQTTNPGSITTQILATSYVDTIVLLNTVAASITIQMTHTTAGVVFNKTYTLTSSVGVSNWFRYFYAPIQRPSDFVISGLPLYGNTTITITINGTSSGAAIGTCILGLSRNISSTGKGVEHGAKISIDDYSVKTRDAFGNFTIQERAFSKTADFTVYINKNEVDGVFQLLSKYRATPIVYIGGKDYAATIVYGFYKSFDIEIAYPTVSICTIQLEGLT